MFFFKILMLSCVFGISVKLGILIANRYKNRVIELKEMKEAIAIFKTKIMFTYEPIPEVFEEIASDFYGNIRQVFKIAKQEMNEMSAGEAWKNALSRVDMYMTKEDIKYLESLSNLLGKTDIEGQLNEIEVTNTYLNTQIEKAESERNKNEKLFRTLGMVVGMAIVIILI